MTLSHSCFFYGTLLHPAVIKRVIRNDGGHLEFCPAILYDYTRHHAKGLDYPGVVPYEQSRHFFDRELSRDERCVRGSLVTGLTADDMRLLDYFEGNEYTRQFVQVHPLAELMPLGSSATQYEHLLEPSDLPSVLPDPVQAEVYIWIEPSLLEPTLWDYETFVKEKLHRWVGDDETVEENYEMLSATDVQKADEV